jgi:hypothetical protein
LAADFSLRSRPPHTKQIQQIETKREKEKERKQRSQTHSIGSLLRRRHSVGSESEKITEQQSEVKGAQRKITLKKKKRRGSREDEWIPSKKRCNAAIPSGACAKQSEEIDKTEKEKEKEREQHRSRMYSVIDRKWKRERERATVGSETRKRKSQQKGSIKRKKCRGCREAECIPSKARSDAAIQSEVKATQSEVTDETDKDTEKEQRRRMYTSKKRCNAAIQSVAGATQSEDTDETGEEKAKETEQRSQMHSIGRLL